jgi:predicted enzyme related to lactoylglutathione lyase
MKIHGKDVAALNEPVDVGQTSVPQWLCFVSVASVEATAERAIHFGGDVLGNIAGDPEIGRMGVVRDPLGALIGIWQPGLHIGARVGLELNTVCWTELSSMDPVVSAGFYSGLFGWTVRNNGEYTEYLLSGASQAGMVNAVVPTQTASAQWNVYFRVGDCDDTAARASLLGGSVLCPPMDIPGVGRFSRLKDPSGGEFFVVRLAED